MEKGTGYFCPSFLGRPRALIVPIGRAAWRRPSATTGLRTAASERHPPEAAFSPALPRAPPPPCSSRLAHLPQQDQKARAFGYGPSETSPGRPGVYSLRRRGGPPRGVRPAGSGAPYPAPARHGRSRGRGEGSGGRGAAGAPASPGFRPLGSGAAAPDGRGSAGGSGRSFPASAAASNARKASSSPLF